MLGSTRLTEWYLPPPLSEQPEPATLPLLWQALQWVELNHNTSAFGLFSTAQRKQEHVQALNTYFYYKKKSDLAISSAPPKKNATSNACATVHVKHTAQVWTSQKTRENKASVSHRNSLCSARHSLECLSKGGGGKFSRLRLLTEVGVDVTSSACWIPTKLMQSFKSLAGSAHYPLFIKIKPL